MSRKRSRVELVPPSNVLSQLSMETTVVPMRWSKTKNTDNGNRVYIESEPRGKDYKDYQFTLRDLTNILHPKLSITLRSYGNNWGGVHRHHNEGATKTTVSTTAVNTDNRRFCLTDMATVGKKEGFGDTVAWDAGTQGWYESIFLPGTWKVTENTSGITSTEDSGIGNQASMTGLMDASKKLYTPLNSGPNTSLVGNTDKDNDYAFHYNGGYQKHVFESLSETDIYYECWELTPRDLEYNWFYFDTNASFSHNIHSLVQADYVRFRPDWNSVQTTMPEIAEEQITYDGNQGNSNQTGRQPFLKNDINFRINKNSETVFERFRVSKPKGGVIKPGGKLVYKLKQGGFKILDSAWLRLWQKPSQSAAVSVTTSQYDNKYIPQLIPRFTRYLVIRFYSGNAVSKHTSGSYTGYMEATTTAGITTVGKLDFNTVAKAPGRMIHTVEEHHSMRAVVASKQTNGIIKDYTKQNFSETDAAMTDNWAAINEETDAFEEVD